MSIWVGLFQSPNIMTSFNMLHKEFGTIPIHLNLPAHVADFCKFFILLALL